MQTQAFRAKFNQGVFEPLEKVSLPEGFDVRVYPEGLDSNIESKRKVKPEPSSSTSLQTLMDKVQDRTSNISPDVVEESVSEAIKEVRNKF